MTMRVAETMTRGVFIVSPEETIQEAAMAMAGIDAGVLPISNGDRLVGMITDRDIAIRGVAEGKGPDTKVRDVMTTEIKYCFDDQEVDDVIRNMGEIQVRRLPVVDRDKRLVGILSLGDVAATASDGKAGEALSKISRPGGEHTQTGWLLESWPAQSGVIEGQFLSVCRRNQPDALSLGGDSIPPIADERYHEDGRYHEQAMRLE